MTFQAIVFAPVLRPRARLCIADLEQTPAIPPQRIGVGAELALRFGTCCPLLAEGTITAVAESPETAILTVDGEPWTIRRCARGTGVSIPGMISENWYVA